MTSRENPMKTALSNGHRMSQWSARSLAGNPPHAFESRCLNDGCRADLLLTQSGTVYSGNAHLTKCAVG
jgi:hypothetical protein